MTGKGRQTDGRMEKVTYIRGCTSYENIPRSSDNLLLKSYENQKIIKNLSIEVFSVNLKKFCKSIKARCDEGSVNN